MHSANSVMETCREGSTDTDMDGTKIAKNYQLGVSIILFIIGLLWALGGFLEYVGFGDAGTPPDEDLIKILLGMMIAFFGGLGFYVSLSKSHNKLLRLGHLLISVIVAVLITIDCVASLMRGSEKVLLWMIVCSLFWLLPVASYKLSKERGCWS